MNYAEASYFDRVPVAHCDAREDHNRLQRIAAQSRAALQRNAARKGRA